MGIVHSGFETPSYLLAQRAIGFQFADGSLTPSLKESDDEPPEWAIRDERWTIDGLLGSYDASQRLITIFCKGIEHIALQLDLDPFHLNRIVTIHEYGHAVFHLGMIQQEIALIDGMQPKSKEHIIADTLRMRTDAYNEVERYVHEQIAQGITSIALTNLRDSEETREGPRKECDKMINAFNALMLKQREEYRLDRVAHLTHEQLSKRLREFIVLTRRRALIPDRGVWDTIMAW